MNQGYLAIFNFVAPVVNYYEFIEYDFNNLNANALFTGHNPKNVASAQLLKKLGFTYIHDEYYPPTQLYLDEETKIYGCTLRHNHLNGGNI